MLSQRDRPRHAAAHVCVVRDADAEADQPAVREGGLDDEDVGRVARSVERVVDHVDVAGREAVAVALEQRLHRVRDRAELERDRDGLRDRLARRPAEGGRVVHRVADDGGMGGAEDRRRHLVRDGGEGVADDRPQDRVRLRSPPAAVRRWSPPGRARARALRSAREPPSIPAARPPSCRTRRRAAAPPAAPSRSRPAPARACRRARGRRRSPRAASAAHAALPPRERRETEASPPRGGPTTVRRSARICDRGPGLEARPVLALVLRLEPRDHHVRVDRPGLAGHVDRDAPVLPPIADVGRAEPFHLAEPFHALGQAAPHLVLEAPQVREVGQAGVDPAEAHVVELGAGEEEPGRREEAGQRRHDGGADAEVGGQGGGVDGPGAAVRDEHELARVAAALGGDSAERAHHRRVREPVDAARRLGELEPERLGDAAHGLRGPLRRHGEIARCERAGRDVPEHDVRVGDRGLLAAEAVAGGAGHGSRAPRADLERSGGIEPREAAPTRADLGDVDGRDPDELTAARGATCSRRRAPRRPRTPGCARRGRPRSATSSRSCLPCRT